MERNNVQKITISLVLISSAMIINFLSLQLLVQMNIENPHPFYNFFWLWVFLWFWVWICVCVVVGLWFEES